MEPQDISTLVERCQRGDLEAFDPLYRHFVQPLYGYVLRRTLQRELAEDLVSQSFMKALENIRQYSPRKGPFAAWIYGIARNAITDHFRSYRPHTEISDVWDLSSDEDVQLDAATRLDAEKIREALKILDPKKREIVLLRLWDGLSYKEIAALTGLTETNAKVRFCRTVAELRKTVPLAMVLLLLFPPFHP